MSLDDRGDPDTGSGPPPRYPGTFLLALREAFAALGWQARRWLADAVECQDAAGEEQLVGLENLYRRARREDRSRWPELIRDFLNRVHEAEHAHPDEDLASVADRLLVRLGQPFTRLGDRVRVWAQPIDGTPLIASLVIDHAETMSYVTEEMVAASGRAGEEWLRQALENLLGRTPADCLQPIDEDTGLLLCNTGDAYDSSRALLLNTLLPQTTEFGCLVALPSRDELLILPVTAQALPFVHLMKMLAEKSFRTAPYPICDQVFWVQQETWRAFGVELRDKTVVLQPPVEFAVVLERLVPEGDAEDADTE